MDDLLKTAFVGTATQTPPPASHPADLLPTETLEPERVVLLRAGARAVWRDAGYVPRRDVAAITPSPPEIVDPVSDRAAALLLTAFESRGNDMLPLFLARLAAACRVLPPEVLPAALSPAGKSSELRASIKSVLGARGRWLARLNPDWSWAAAEDVAAADADELRRIWDEGTPAQRTEALRRLRELDPAEARFRLAEAFKTEKAEARAQLLEPLAVGLSGEDELFLEATLDDRSEAVRAAAADLLAALPTSQFVARMTERGDAMLSGARSGLLKKKLTLACEPPTEIGKDWLRDGVPKTAPAGSGQGPRALWAETVIGCVPPGHWVDRFGATPEQLVEGAPEDYGEEVVAGWTAAATRGEAVPGRAAWLPVLADYWVERIVATAPQKDGTARAGKHLRAAEHLPRAFSGLDPTDAERRLTALFRREGDSVRAALWLLPSLPRPWSASFTRAWLGQAVAALNSKARSHAHEWVTATGVAGAAIPEKSFDEALAAFQSLADGNHAHARFLDIVRLRREFYDAVPLRNSAG